LTRSDLYYSILTKKSFLCVGLDPDIEKIPHHLLSLPDPVFEFNKQIIDATIEFAVAYKPNTAFYEAMGSKGWESLKKTMNYLPKDVFTIADAKRGDLGNSSSMYARAFFKEMDFDAVTVAPYMGEDSIRPFLEYKEKWIIVLVHTSNPGSTEFQLAELKSGKKLFEEVITRSQSWATPDQLMYVVGATHADKFKAIRSLAPEHFFLVPGVGAQGGDLDEVSRHGMNAQCGLLVNSSRSILYGSSGKDFAEVASLEAKKIQTIMSKYLA
jgi:orotidine-5'-phosphate decarboxylase